MEIKKNGEKGGSRIFNKTVRTALSLAELLVRKPKISVLIPLSLCSVNLLSLPYQWIECSVIKLFFLSAPYLLSDASRECYFRSLGHTVCILFGFIYLKALCLVVGFQGERNREASSESNQHTFLILKNYCFHFQIKIHNSFWQGLNS